MKVGVIVGIIFAMVFAVPSASRAQELYPKHINAATQKSIKAGLDYLASTQSPDGNWAGSQDGAMYSVTMTSLAGMAFLANGNTSSRGPYAENIRRATGYVMTQANASGLICSGPEFNGRSMYGHGFGLLFLASAYGMETDTRRRDQMKTIISKGLQLTSTAQSRFGGWTYTPGGGDEGSVTVTQMQALRAASNAGFTVPKGTIEGAIKYLELCKTPEGGIVYSYGSGGGPRLAISAAALATLYNAGDYDSQMSSACLAYVTKQFTVNKGWNKGTGHEFYTHLYASQAFYQAGDTYWNDYFPQARDELLKMQSKEGMWTGDGIGPVYGSSIALIILQLPYKYLPVYQR